MGNTVPEATTFNGRLQPVDIQAGTSGSLLHLAYDYGSTANNGNVLQQTMTAQGNTYVQTYYYDGVNRLCITAENTTAVSLSSCPTAGPLGTTWWQRYVYDNVGNRALLASSYGTSGTAQAQVTSTTSTLPYDGHNQWTGASHDAGGNEITVSAGTTAATYDGENRLTSVTENTMPSIAYKYDGEGRRVQKTVGTVMTEYVHDASGETVAEYGGNAPVLAPTLYLTTDALGSTRLETDGSGSLVALRDYAPFGEALPTGIGTRGSAYGTPAFPSTTGNSTGPEFTSKERDSESGLDYFGARYFSSAQGRFTTPDWSENPEPIPYANLSDPQTLNLYSYVRNNPLSNRDVDGHCSVDGEEHGFVWCAAHFVGITQTQKEVEAAKAKFHVELAQFEESQRKLQAQGQPTLLRGEITFVPEASNFALFQEYTNGLRAAMSAPTVIDAELKGLIEQLYRPGASIGRAARRLLSGKNSRRVQKSAESGTYRKQATTSRRWSGGCKRIQPVPQETVLLQKTLSRI